ncbi:hypothetical protein KUCAC02_009953 [Chaenocephalus aceratus]|uniref:Uncharacterized protein n=1 Tax=Chaenocephalus aceratus TaxID=36190 RepID=A0ACB9VXS4_CHAAC|nr:hypothetical protein KUCAC02_009953 [Chaenocephalus aceratus]
MPIGSEKPTNCSVTPRSWASFLQEIDVLVPQFEVSMGATGLRDCLAHTVPPPVLTCLRAPHHGGYVHKAAAKGRSSGPKEQRNEAPRGLCYKHGVSSPEQVARRAGESSIADFGFVVKKSAKY